MRVASGIARARPMRALVQLLFPFLGRGGADVMPMAKPDAPPKAKPSPAPARPAARARPARAKAAAGAKRPAKRVSARQAAYDAVVEEMKATYGFRVRKWRRSMSGCAWELLYRDGRRQRMLESPYPKSPLSCSIFLHEVGHHAIGLGVVRPRCLEELKAWEWSIAAMEARGLEVDEKVRDRFRRSMEYAVAKASRRGIKSLPDELVRFVQRV